MHIASNGLWGHGDLKTTSEVILPQIWNQQPWLPWYPCAYCLQRPLRPWWPPRPWRHANNLIGHMTSDLTSVTLITLVSMPILHPTAILVASEAMATSKWPRRSRLTSKLNSVTSITYVPMLLWPVKASLRWFKPGSGQALLQDVRQLVPFSAIRYSIITQPPVLYTASSSCHSRCIKRGVALVKIAHLRRWAITVWILSICKRPAYPFCS